MSVCNFLALPPNKKIIKSLGVSVAESFHGPWQIAFWKQCMRSEKCQAASTYDEFYSAASSVEMTFQGPIVPFQVYIFSPTSFLDCPPQNNVVHHQNDTMMMFLFSQLVRTAIRTGFDWIDLGPTCEL